MFTNTAKKKDALFDVNSENLPVFKKYLKKKKMKLWPSAFRRVQPQLSSFLSLDAAFVWAEKSLKRECELLVFVDEQEERRIFQS